MKVRRFLPAGMLVLSLAVSLAPGTSVPAMAAPGGQLTFSYAFVLHMGACGSG